MAAVSAIARSRRLAIIETATTSGRLESHVALVTAVAVPANWLLFIAFILTGQIGGFGFALHDHETRRHVPARLPPSPDGIVSRLCGQMAVVLGQLPHVGTVDGQ